MQERQGRSKESFRRGTCNGRGGGRCGRAGGKEENTSRGRDRRGYSRMVKGLKEQY